LILSRIPNNEVSSDSIQGKIDSEGAGSHAKRVVNCESLTRINTPEKYSRGGRKDCCKGCLRKGQNFLYSALSSGELFISNHRRENREQWPSSPPKTNSKTQDPISSKQLFRERELNEGRRFSKKIKVVLNATEYRVKYWWKSAPTPRTLLTKNLVKGNRYRKSRRPDILSMVAGYS